MISYYSVILLTMEMSDNCIFVILLLFFQENHSQCVNIVALHKTNKYLTKNLHLDMYLYLKGSYFNCCRSTKGKKTSTVFRKTRFLQYVNVMYVVLVTQFRNIQTCDRGKRTYH